MTRVDGRNRCSSASFTIERRGRKGRKEKLHFVAAFAQRSLFASDYRRPHSASSVQEHSASSVPSILRREFRALYGVSCEHSTASVSSTTVSVASTLRREFRALYDVSSRALYGVSSEHSTTSVPEHSTARVPSTLRRQFPSTLRRQFPERCPCYHSPQLPEVLSCATDSRA